MEKNVYIWNSNNIWIDQKPVDDKYQLQPNETFDKVPDGLLAPIKRVGAQTGSWQGATPEEHEAYVKSQQDKHPQQPTPQQQLNAATSLQLAQLMASQKAQDKLNAQFTIDMAQIKAALQKDDNKERAQA